MEGLEAVELKLSQCKNIIDFRIDANTYKKDYIFTDKLIRLKEHSTIDKLATSVQNFGAYSLCNFINFTETGIPFLMTANIRHNFIDWNIQKYVDEESHQLLLKSHCKKGQVLVTMAGEYLGRVAVYDKDFVCSSNQAIAKITLNKGENPYLISTFLNTKFGQNQINRFKTITGQPNINMSLIKDLLIPKFNNKFSLEIEAIIKKSEFKRNTSNNSYALAEQHLLFEIGLLGNMEVGFTEENLGDWVSDDPTEQMLSNLAPGPREELELLQAEWDSIMAEQDRLKAIIDYDGEIAHWNANKATLDYLVGAIAEKATQVKYIQNNKNIAALNDAAKKKTNIKSFSESFGTTGRLDAEYYQKKYEVIIERIKAQKHDVLKNIVTISKSIEPGSAHYSEDGGMPFYRVSDFNKFGLSQPNKELTDAYVVDNKALIEKIKPKKDTILFSKDGSVGTGYLLREDLNGITSGAILHLKVKNTKEIIPEYLTLALNSILVQMQAERDAGGSIILHWRKEEIEQVIVPIIDYKIQEKIATLVEESFRLKSESEQLLAIAKRAVEIAIEHDEAAALRYIAANK